MQSPKILFFIGDSNPTLEERKAAALFGVPVAFRNSRHISEDDKPEECAGVAGEIIPKPYENHPSVEAALSKWKDEMVAEIERSQEIASGEPAKPASVGNGQKKEWGADK